LSSNDILQHLAESCRNTNAQDVGTDRQQEVSTGSVYPQEATQDAYDSIEAEIDQLKEDVLKLREEADKDRTSAKTEQEVANDRFLSTPSGRRMQTTEQAPVESAATRLQRLHEAKDGSNASIHNGKIESQLLPSPLDFPSLATSTASSRVASPAELLPISRKTSYANAASTGVADAADPGSSTTLGLSEVDDPCDSSDQAQPCTPTTNVRTRPPLSLITQNLDDQTDHHKSVPASSAAFTVKGSRNIDTVISRNGRAPAVDGKAARHGPHFAQPTQSYSRRAGETVRSTLSPGSVKNSPDGSPSKHTKPREPSLATTKRAAAREQKRKSLPTGWLGLQSPSVAENKSALELAAPQATPSKLSSPTGVVSPASANVLSVIDPHKVKENAGTTHSKPTRLQQTPNGLQKAKSHPSSPSAVASAEKTIVVQSPHAKHEPTAIWTTNAENSDASKIHRSATMSSDGSFVQIIVDGKSSSVLPALKSSEQQSPKKAFRHAGASPTKTTLPSLASSSPTKRIPDRRFKSALPIPASSIPQLSPQQSGKCNVTRHRAATDLASLPEVANTTMQRRTSLGHLLKPIIGRLDANGLLNASPTGTGNAIFDSYLESVAAEVAGSAGSPDTATSATVMVNKENLDLPPSTSKSGNKTVTAHAAEPRETGELSILAGGNTDVEQSTILNISDHAGQSSRTLVTSPVTGSAGLPTNADPSNSGSYPTPAQRSSSLRATANEFRPMLASMSEALRVDIDDVLQYQPEETWQNMSPVDRKVVQSLRYILNNGSVMAMNGLAPKMPTLPTLSTTIGPGAGNTSQGLFSPATATPSTTEKTSPHTVQAGQVLRPTLSPGKKSVQWLLQDLDGKETPISFGRAPPPQISPIFSPTADPSISPNSNHTSPSRTPYPNVSSLRGWHIGSASPHAVYGWRGGDGKEIKFVGYGPHAERDPNSVVNFDFRGNVETCAASGLMNGFSTEDEKENFDLGGQHENGRQFWDRKQRNWAARQGYPRVPCGNVKIDRAAEVYGGGIAGFCHGCVG